MSKTAKNILIQSFKVLFSVGIIFWLIQSGKLNFAALQNLLTPGVAALGFFLVFLNVFFVSERWRVLIQSQGLKVSAFSVYKLSLIGGFFNFAMPGGVGGDVVKAFYFSRENPGSKVVAVTSVLMDRILGLFALVVLALIVMVYDYEHVASTPALKTLFWFIVGLFSLFATALSLIFSTHLYQQGHLNKVLNHMPLAAKLLKVYESTHLYGSDKKRIFFVIFISLIAQVCSIFFLYIAGTASGIADIPLKTYFLVAPLGFMATAIPISPAGVGVGQAAFYFLFNIYMGQTTELGPTAITAFQVTNFCVSLLGAFFYLRRKDKALPAELN